jgi:hypothetical protein
MTDDDRVEQRRKNAIEKWMLTIVEDGGVERHDDLHVDQVDENWKRPEMWVEAGLETLRLAFALREKHRLPLTLTVAFSLKSQKEFGGVNFQSREQFIECLDWSPPSLYLLRPGEEPWLTVIRSVQQGLVKPGAFVEGLPTNLLGLCPEISRCFYMEFQSADGAEDSRTVLFESEFPSNPVAPIGK